MLNFICPDPAFPSGALVVRMSRPGDGFGPGSVYRGALVGVVHRTLDEHGNLLNWHAEMKNHMLDKLTQKEKNQLDGLYGSLRQQEAATG